MSTNFFGKHFFSFTIFYRELISLLFRRERFADVTWELMGALIK